ncbi:HD-GYP domain-containing protein [Brachyspira hampsonii]|uniref:Phosphohydrolase n=1 Tax=Brachyspira hampsonii TaxID=1287055 RepID=A0AAC9XKW0_9SPIR|nr:HD domain-containing phosphohydrolase [Brachyspira hampsonii]ASJ21881.1 phosphohydrolase [Brachyspira hampsonii]ELV04944.1 metal dependent phosphohydrolase [Brachyspira hampsonii 30599]MBW5380911.1 HD domain-containing protein [Brachyspira hampsonii]MBW5409518.1 HD domain-containing protein [Brachyspira hampsonii]OEJ17260.1 phosphohydrolase [Brachyspira hampsonii]
MPKIIIPLNEVKEGMKVASNIYNSDEKRIVDIGTVITKDIIETLKRNSITTISVMELLDLKKENTVNTSGDGKKAVLRGVIEENGKKILKIDSQEVAKKQEAAIEKTKSLYETAKNGGGIDFDSMKKEVNTMLSSIVENKDAHSYLSMLKRKDETMYKHAVDVATLAAITAGELNLTKVDMSNIMLGALVHDIGKVLIQESLLSKVNLTKEEGAILKKHPTQGYKLVKRDNLDDNIADIVLEHHEKYDGTGYPFQKDNKDISLYSKIVSICNTFNNLITKGEHGVPCTPDKAVKIIISLAKKDFDSDVVKAFQKAVGFYPNNTRVKLSNGSIARVIEQNPNLPLRPVLSIVKHLDGTVSDGLEVVDLSVSSDLFIKEIM